MSFCWTSWNSVHHKNFSKFSMGCRSGVHRWSLVTYSALLSHLGWVSENYEFHSCIVTKSLQRSTGWDSDLYPSPMVIRVSLSHSKEEGRPPWLLWPYSEVWPLRWSAVILTFSTLWEWIQGNFCGTHTLRKPRCILSTIRDKNLLANYHWKRWIFRSPTVYLCK